MPKSCLAMVPGQLIQYIHSPPYFHLGRHLMHLVQLQHLMHLMHLLYHLMMHLHLFTLASSAPPVRCNACTPIIIFYFISNYAVVWTLSTQTLKTYPNKTKQIEQFCENVRCPKQCHWWGLHKMLAIWMTQYFYLEIFICHGKSWHPQLERNSKWFIASTQLLGNMRSCNAGFNWVVKTGDIRLQRHWSGIQWMLCSFRCHFYDDHRHHWMRR